MSASSDAMSFGSLATLSHQVGHLFRGDGEGGIQLGLAP